MKPHCRLSLRFSLNTMPAQKVLSGGGVAMLARLGRRSYLAPTADQKSFQPVDFFQVTAVTPAPLFLPVTLLAIRFVTGDRPRPRITNARYVGPLVIE